jgi:hypothetical protein
MVSQIRHHVNEDLCINVLTSSLAHILAREPDIRSRAGEDMDESRMDVSIENILCFWQIVSGNPSNFVFNMDEMEYQESADGLRMIYKVFHPDTSISISAE